MSAFDLVKFFDEKAAWSLATFGPQQRVSGVVAHMRKELAEVREALAAGDSGKACEEFVDVALLAIDLAWRSSLYVDGLVFVTALNKCQRFWIGDSTFEGAASSAIQGMLLGAVEVHLSAIERSGLWWPVRIVERAAMIWEIAMAGAAAEPREAERRLLAKYSEIQTRKVKDWRDVPADQPIEHIREEDQSARVLPPVTFAINPSTATPTEMAAKVSAAINNKLGTVVCHRPDSSALVLPRDLPPGAPIKVGDDTMTIAQLVAEHHELAAIREDVRHPPDIIDGLNRELDKVRAALGAKVGESAGAAAARVREELRGMCDAHQALGETLAKRKTEWQGDNERLREERQQVREILGARPNEGVIEAARRVMVRPVDTNPGAALAPGEEAPQ